MGRNAVRDDKERDMIRSILPSTKRKDARQNKARAARTHRRTARHVINNYRYDVADEDCDDAMLDAFDSGIFSCDHANRYGWDTGTRDIVSRRREYDKVAPICRWAVEVTKGEPAERMGQIAPLLSNTPMGRHALTHIKNVEEFRDDQWSFMFLYRRNDPSFEFLRAVKYAEVVDALVKISEMGLISKLNDAFDRAYTHREWVESGDTREWSWKVCPIKFTGSDIDGYIASLVGPNKRGRLNIYNYQTYATTFENFVNQYVKED